MSLIVELPVDVIRHRLLPFLGVKGLVRLDSAVCATTERFTFLTHLDSLVLSDSQCCTTKAMRWLQMRNVFTMSLHLNDDSEMVMSAALPMLSKVSRLETYGELRHFNNETLRDLIESINSLTTVAFHSDGCLSRSYILNDDVIECLASHHPHLESIEIDTPGTCNYLITDRSVNAIAVYCTELQSISLSYSAFIRPWSIATT